MLSVVTQGFDKAKRIQQTTFVINQTAMKWVLGHRPSTPVILREVCDKLGATYTKLGQLIASSPSLFPTEYVEAFQGCFDQTPPLPFKIIDQIIRDELGPRIDEFKHIEPVALASASIAQVHAAELKTGEQVVIKVQKPNIRARMEADMSFLETSSQISEWLLPALKHMSLRDVMREIRQGLREECDFKQEVQNIEAYHDFLEMEGSEFVKVPKVHHSLCTGQVITMERFYGRALSEDIEGILNEYPKAEASLVNAMNVWFQSIYLCQMYHADLHAGNLLLLKDGTVGFIDFGLVGRIPKEIWEALMSLSISIPMQDYKAIAEAMLTIGVTKAKVDTDKLAKDLEELMGAIMMDNHSFPGAPTSGGDSIDQMLLKVGRLAERYGIRFPRTFTLLIKQFLYFDRYIHYLAPDLDMLIDDRLGWNQKDPEQLLLM